MATFLANGAIFHYNSDLSGGVTIIVKGKDFTVNGEDLLDFIAYFVRNEKVTQLEQADTLTIFGLKENE